MEQGPEPQLLSQETFIYGESEGEKKMTTNRCKTPEKDMECE